MRYRIGKNGLPIDLDQQDVIGQGGEAVIFGKGGLAYKVYHAPNAQRTAKLEEFLSFKASLPDGLARPLQMLFGAKAQAVGFEMPLLPPGTHPLAMLMRRDFCDQQGLGNDRKAAIFQNLADDLKKIHQAGFVVGDLNDQNQRFSPADHQVGWLDVDSWQKGLFPCIVGTEDYLSPDLYGQNLTLSPLFKTEHDWYSFAVLLFRALMYAHPFGSGAHKQFQSLFDRAKNRLTIIDADVRYPKKANPPEVITDDLMDLLLKYLKRQEKGEFPLRALESYAEILVECPSCHLWYPANRHNCPGCSQKTIVTGKIKARIDGCVYELLLETPGTIIYHQMCRSEFCCLAEEKGMLVLYRKRPGGALNRKEVIKAPKAARYAIFEDVLAVCTDVNAEEPAIFLIDIAEDQPKPITKTTTNSLSGGSAIFGSSGRRLYRLSGSSIVSGEIFGHSLADRQVMQAIPNQTWFVVASNPELVERHEVLFGGQRFLGDMNWFLAVGDTDGRRYVNHPVDLQPLLAHESIIDISVRFGAETALVMRRTRVRGVNHILVDVVNIADGKIVRSARQKIANASNFDSVHGKGYLDGCVLHATEDGIAIDSLDGKESILKGTGVYIAGDEQLIRFGSGIIAIAQDKVFALNPE